MRLFLFDSEAPALELTHLIKKEPFFISLYSILYGNRAAHCVTVIELWLPVLDGVPEKRLSPAPNCSIQLYQIHLKNGLSCVGFAG